MHKCRGCNASLLGAGCVFPYLLMCTPHRDPPLPNSTPLAAFISSRPAPLYSSMAAALTAAAEHNDTAAAGSAQQPTIGSSSSGMAAACGAARTTTASTASTAPDMFTAACCDVHEISCCTNVPMHMDGNILCLSRRKELDVAAVRRRDDAESLLR